MGWGLLQTPECSTVREKDPVVRKTIEDTSLTQIIHYVGSESCGNRGEVLWCKGRCCPLKKQKQNNC